jgi:hypothetical protein
MNDHTGPGVGVKQEGRALARGGLGRSGAAQLESRSATGLCLAWGQLLHLDTSHICDWLASSHLATEPGRLPAPILIELNFLRGSGQLVLAVGPTAHLGERPAVSHTPSDVCS